MKIILAAFLICLVGSKAYAQDFLGGLTAGINATEVDGDQMGGMNKISFYAGFLVEYPFTEKVSGSIEFAYSREGSRRTVNKDGSFGPGRWHLLRLNYVDVPVSVHYRATDKIRGHAGLAGAYLLNYYYEEFAGVPVEFDTVPYKKFDLTGHAGLEYIVAEDKFHLIGRFSYSLLNFGHGKTVFGRASGLRNKLVMIGGRYYL